MRKNQKDDAKQAFEQALKTDSEKKESAKSKTKDKGPELNDPMFDVTVTPDGDADVVSEKAIDEVDYPPELAEFLGETMQGLHDQLGLGEDEPIPEGILNGFYEKLFSTVDIERLVHELRAEKVFGIEPDESVPKMPLEDEESDDVEDELPDWLTDVDFSKLEVDECGSKILHDFSLSCPKEPKGVILQKIPVEVDEEFKKNRVIIRIYIPFLSQIPISEIKPGTEYYDKTGCFMMNETDAFEIDPETYTEMQELLESCGVSKGAMEAEEGEDLSEKVAEYFSKGDVIDGDFAPREDGYYEDMMEYWYDGKIYHETDVIWFELPRTVNLMGNMKGFSANLDSFSPLYEPCDITRAKGIKVENYRRVLSEEEKEEIEAYGKNMDFFTQLLPFQEVWYLASEFAKTKDTSGYCVVCLGGKFNVPVEGILNPETLEFENLIVAFNVMNCFPIHHKCTGVLVADVGNMQLQTAVRYAKGRVFDWRKRIDQELAAYHLHDPDFDPYEDPYDNPHNADTDG